MNRIVFASRNEGKIKEIKALLEGLDCTVASLNHFENIPGIIEDGHSFFENALKKARIVSESTGEIVLADDSGLEVDHLDGAPGIYSARYAGSHATDEENYRKVLKLLEDIPMAGRGCTFRCVLILYRPDGRYESFEGLWRGVIAAVSSGSGGFGYDPIFFLPDLGLTAAQLPSDLKNQISHRGRAFQQLKYYLQNQAYPHR